MTVIFIGIILAIFFGGICLWISGRLFGLRSAPKGISEHDHNNAISQSNELSNTIETMKEEVHKSTTEASKAKSDKAEAEAEIARVAIEMGRVEGEMSRAEAEITRLQEEIESLKKRDKPNIPIPKVSQKHQSGSFAAVNHESEVFDDIQVELDMERVAHQKTKDELEQVKKIASIKINGGNMTGKGRNGAGFQTVSISTRSSNVSGTDHDRLRQQFDQLKREKEKLDSELSRSKQELQLLKMRPK